MPHSDLTQRLEVYRSVSAPSACGIFSECDLFGAPRVPSKITLAPLPVPNFFTLQNLVTWMDAQFLEVLICLDLDRLCSYRKGFEQEEPIEALVMRKIGQILSDFFKEFAFLTSSPAGHHSPSQNQLCDTLGSLLPPPQPHPNCGGAQQAISSGANSRQAMLVEDLVGVLDQTHDRLMKSDSVFDAQAEATLQLHQFCSVILFGLAPIIVGEEIAFNRCNVMSCLLRNVLHFPSLSHGRCCQLLHVASSVGVAFLCDHAHRRVPRGVIEKILRPVLCLFCHTSNLSSSLVLGLNNVIAMFPHLFNASFAHKVFTTLQEISTNASTLQYSRRSDCIWPEMQ
jgi:hypothetical protein